MKEDIIVKLSERLDAI